MNTSLLMAIVPIFVVVLLILIPTVFRLCPVLVDSLELALPLFLFDSEESGWLSFLFLLAGLNYFSVVLIRTLNQKIARHHWPLNRLH